MKLVKKIPVKEATAQPLDPLERYGPLALKLLLYLILTIIFFQAVETFAEVRPYTPWPFLLRLVRNGIFLFLHEGGHALFWFFGDTIRSLGGSFWQIMFPLISFVIAVRQRSHVVAPFMLFWVGENMLDVSVYMRDAPLRRLQLLGGHKSGHDWWNIFRSWDMLDSAETVADVMYFSGALISVAAIIGGVALAIYFFLHPKPKKSKFYEDPEDKSDSSIKPPLPPFVDQTPLM